MEKSRVISIRRSMTTVEMHFPGAHLLSLIYNTLTKSPSFAGVMVEKANPTKKAFTLSVKEKSGLMEFTMIFHFSDFNIMATQFTISARIRKKMLVWERISAREPRSILERMTRKRTIPIRLNIFIPFFISSHISRPGSN
jgi:hypothetical protein